MWIVAVPLFLILIIVLFLGAGIFEAMEINIIPIISMLFLGVGVVSFVLFFAKRKQKENKEKLFLLLFATISIIVFLCTLGNSMSIGDILSWIWYHI